MFDSVQPCFNITNLGSRTSSGAGSVKKHHCAQDSFQVSNLQTMIVVETVDTRSLLWHLMANHPASRLQMSL